MTRFILCTAKFSDNLGDGVISDCVEFLIKKAGKNPIVQTLDISGRQEYDKSVEKKNDFKKIIFHLSPDFIKPLVTILGWVLIFRPRLKNRIDSIELNNQDKLIFGGGQLINDVALNFPLKVNYICKRAGKKGVYYSFNGVGVGQKSSYFGKKLYKEIFSSQYLHSIYVRDKESFEAITEIYEQNDKIYETVDSGLWAADCYNLSTNENKPTNLHVGVGISHPKELNAHTSASNDILEDSISFWVAIVKELIKKGFKPVLFTNGSRDDHSYLSLVESKLKYYVESGEIEVLNRATSPVELVQNISKFNALISHRLHANIVAHSFGIPSIALTWDEKVKSYFKIIDRLEWCYSDTTKPEIVAEGLAKALKKGLNTSLISDLKQKSLDNLRQQLGNN